MSATIHQEENIPRLLASISSEGTSFLKNDLHARMRLLEAARALVSELETPRETVVRMCWGEVSFPVLLCGQCDRYQGLTVANRRISSPLL